MAERVAHNDNDVGSTPAGTTIFLLSNLYSSITFYFVSKTGALSCLLKIRFPLTPSTLGSPPKTLASYNWLSTDCLWAQYAKANGMMYAEVCQKFRETNGTRRFFGLF